jgi:hypothetical protein
MDAQTTHVRSPKAIIRRLRALADEIDRAVKAAVQVRREVHRSFAAQHHRMAVAKG